MNFDDLYLPRTLADNKEKSLSDNATDILRSFQICGKDVPRGYWVGTFVYLSYDFRLIRCCRAFICPLWGVTEVCSHLGLYWFEVRLKTIILGYGMWNEMQFTT